MLVGNVEVDVVNEVEVVETDVDVKLVLAINAKLMEETEAILCVETVSSDTTEATDYWFMS